MDKEKAKGGTRTRQKFIVKYMRKRLMTFQTCLCRFKLGTGGVVAQNGNGAYSHDNDDLS